MQRSKASLDPAFGKIPFAKWLAEANPGPFHWSARVARTQLSFHQRLVTRVELTLDGRDLEPRRGDGELVIFVQITDSGGNLYQHHHAIDLAKLDENIRSSNLEYLQRAFVLPGDYQVAAAIFDTRSGEHGTRQLQFRVTPPRTDWLPEAWHELPPVELISSEEPPESWYLPEIHGKTQWAAAAHSPARLNVMLNVAPSAPEPRSHRTTSGAMAALVPTLKVLSETGSASLGQHLEMLDLARRRSVLRQDDGRELNWDRFKTALDESNTASIDIHSLSDRHRDAQFFVSRVRKAMTASEGPCVLVVLTPPVAFESGEDLAPISLEGLPACRVFYVRYREPVEIPVRPPYAVRSEAAAATRAMWGRWDVCALAMSSISSRGH